MTIYRNYTDYLPQFEAKKESATLMKDGIIISDEKQTYFNIPKLANHLAELLHGYADVTGNLHLYNNSTGTVNRLAKADITRILKAYICAVAPELWSNRYLSQLYDLFVMEFNVKEFIAPNSNYLSFPNGTLALKDFEFTAHSPSNLSTNFINCEYDSNATCPTFDLVLAEIFSDDTATVDCFWEVLGSFFYYGSGYGLKKLVLFCGADSQRKNFLTETIRFVLEEHHCSYLGADELNKSVTSSLLQNKWVNISSNLSVFNNPVNTNMLGNILAGKAVTTSSQRAGQVATPIFTHFLFDTATFFPINSLANDVLDAFHIFSFPNRTPADEDTDENDTELKEIVFDEQLLTQVKAEKQGIITTALQHLQQLLQRNWVLTPSVPCQTATLALQNALNIFESFCDEHIQVAPKQKVERKDVINTFYGYQTIIQLGNTRISYSREEVATNLVQCLREKYPHANIDCKKRNGYYYFLNVQLI